MSKRKKPRTLLRRLIASQHADRAVDAMLTSARGSTTKTRYRNAIGESAPDARVPDVSPPGQKRKRRKKFSYGEHRPIWAAATQRNPAVSGPPAIADRPASAPPRHVKPLNRA